jgi:hypothetical protein
VAALDETRGDVAELGRKILVHEEDMHARPPNRAPR